MYEPLTITILLTKNITKTTSQYLILDVKSLRQTLQNATFGMCMAHTGNLFPNVSTFYGSMKKKIFF